MMGDDDGLAVRLLPSARENAGSSPRYSTLDHEARSLSQG